MTADSPGKLLSPVVLQARTACEHVFTEFHRLIDAGAAIQAIDLFTPDGVFEVRGRTFNGREAILDFLREREQREDRHTRHLGSNFAFALTSPTQAHASAQLLIVAGDGGEPKVLALEAVSDCTVTFAKSSSGVWRMTSRRHRRFATANARQRC